MSDSPRPQPPAGPNVIWRWSWFISYNGFEHAALAYARENNVYTSNPQPGDLLSPNLILALQPFRIGVLMEQAIVGIYQIAIEGFYGGVK